MPAQRKPAQEAIDKIGVMPSVTGNTEERKSKLKTKLGLKSIKDELSSIFEDKESRTAVVGAIGLGILAYVLKPEEREEFEEETREEIEELKASGSLTKKEKEDVEEYYEKVEEAEKEDDPDKQEEEACHYRNNSSKGANPTLGYFHHTKAAGGKVQAENTSQHHGTAKQGIHYILYC